LRAETETPYGIGTLSDLEQFSTVLVTEQNVSIVETDGQKLSIRRPIAIEALRLG